MNIHEIYNQLMAGKTLELEFPNRKVAETLRVQIARYKGSQDQHLIDLGMMSEDERQKFSFAVQGKLPLEDPAGTVTVTMAFKDRAVLKQYTVKIIEEDGSHVEA